MKLLQLQYWVTMYPAMFADRDATALPRGGHLMGTWSLLVEDLSKREILEGLKHLFVDPLLAAKREGVLNVGQATELESLRQVKHLLMLGKRSDLTDLATHQHIEHLEGGHLTIVHNIQPRIVAELSDPDE